MPIGRVRLSSNNDVQDSPTVKFSSKLEEKQLRMCVEVSEVKSYRLSDEGNTVTIKMTFHNILMFLDDGRQ